MNSETPLHPAAPSWVGIFMRGLAMGAADVVPGVSGGTVAFITGIYEQLIESIRSINPTACRILFTQGAAAAWRHINGNFLTCLFAGILLSIISLARLISYCLEHYPLLVWSFFFGLILASSIHMARQIRQWRLSMVLALLVGTLLAYGVTELKPSELSPTVLMFFLAGSVAICAMILPGISGSFMLVLMGMYGHVLAAIKSFDWVILVSFAGGCGVGLLSFSHILSWLFRRFHDHTMALLTGFLVGSLNLVWPWKHALSYYENSKGERLALEQMNVLPSQYTELQSSDSQAVLCVALMLLGVLLVYLLEKVGQKSLKTA